LKILHVAKLLGVNTNGIDNVVNMLVKHQSISNNVFVDVLDTNKNDNFSSFFRFRDFDLIIFHSIFCFKTWLCILFCLSYAIPYVIVPHSGLTKASFKKSKVKKEAVMSLFLKKLIYKSAAVHFLNVDEKNNSYEYYSNSFIIPNGVCVPDIQIEKKLDKRYLAFLGRYDINHKGIDILLSAVNVLKSEFRYNNVTLRMHGHDKNSHSIEYIKKYIENNNLSDLVVLKGPIIDNDEKVKYLTNASAYILTSRYEGFPITVLEALSVDVPCLVTKETNVSQLIENNNFGLTCFANVESVVDMLRTYLKNSIAGSAFSPSRDYVVDNYSWAVIGTKLLTEYEKVIRREK